MAGRPSKLNDNLCNAISKNIAEGNTLRFSVEKEGVTYRTHCNWMERGEKAKSGKFFHYFHSIKKAEEEGKNFLVRGIKEHGKKNWQAMAWLLERKYPHEFGRRENVKMEHSGSVKQEHKGKVKVENVFQRIDRLKSFVDEGNEDEDRNIPDKSTE